MGEYMFGIMRTKLNQRTINRLDKICKEEGGHGLNGGNIPGTGIQYWFCGPNYGDPFDRQLAARVKARVREEFPELEV